MRDNVELLIMREDAENSVKALILIFMDRFGCLCRLGCKYWRDRRLS